VLLWYRHTHDVAAMLTDAHWAGVTAHGPVEAALARDAQAAARVAEIRAQNRLLSEGLDAWQDEPIPERLLAADRIAAAEAALGDYLQDKRLADATLQALRHTAASAADVQAALGTARMSARRISTTTSLGPAPSRRVTSAFTASRTSPP
jgi:anti-sigma factor RsiW